MAGLTAYYAAALYELALEQDTLDDCLVQAAVIRDALQNGNGRVMMEHPRMSGANKRALLNTVLPENTQEDLIGFLHMLIAQRQEGLIVPSLTAFIDKGTRKDTKEKILAHIVSATELKEDQSAALQHMLARKLNKRIELSATVDPSLIGGFRIYVKGLVIDRTIKKQLSDLRDTIKKGGAI